MPSPRQQYPSRRQSSSSESSIFYPVLSTESESTFNSTSPSSHTPPSSYYHDAIKHISTDSTESTYDSSYLVDTSVSSDIQDQSAPPQRRSDRRSSTSRPNNKNTNSKRRTEDKDAYESDDDGSGGTPTIQTDYTDSTEEDDDESSVTSSQTSSILWRKATALIKSRISHPSSPLPSPISNLTDFDLRNCLNVIYDIALDLSSISKGQKGEMTDDTLMDLRKQEDREFAKVVSGREFFPRQVANFIDLDRCVKMCRAYLEGNPGSEGSNKYAPKILDAVLTCILLNKDVIDVADKYTVKIKTKTGINIVKSLVDQDSGFSCESFDSASSIFSTESGENDIIASDAINKSFRRSTFASILRESFKIIETCTGTHGIHDSMSQQRVSSLSEIVKILLCYVNGGKTQYFTGGKKGKVIVPVPRFVKDGEREPKGGKSDYKYVVLTALKSLQNILSPPPILPSNNDSSANNTTYIRELSSFNAVNTALSGHLRREIIDSMLNIVKFRKYSTFALETSVDILSRLISYNVGSLRSNETISLITNEALNNYVETGRRKTKLAIDMRDSSYVNSMFQTDHRSLNTSDTVINTLKTVRKILLHSSSRGAKVHSLRIMNAFVAHFSKDPQNPSVTSPFERYESTIKDIIFTKFFTKPILAAMVDAYKVMEAFKHDTKGRFKEDKQVLLLNNSRKIMCLSTQYCSNLAASEAGRSVIIECERDARTAIVEGKSQSDEFDETVVNYLDSEDLEEAIKGKRKGSEEEGEEDTGSPPTLFNGIIRWGFVDVLPSFQSSRSVSATSESSSAAGAGESHFLHNNTKGMYVLPFDANPIPTLDLLWNNIDVYYDPPHPGMDKFKDYNRTDDDCSTVASNSRHGAGYMLGNVRPVNSIVAFNLTSVLLSFSRDPRYLIDVLESDAMKGLVVRFAAETDGRGKVPVKDDIYALAEDNMRRCARMVHANMKERCEDLALSIVKRQIKRTKKSKFTKKK